MVYKKDAFFALILLSLYIFFFYSCSCLWITDNPLNDKTTSGTLKFSDRSGRGCLKTKTQSQLSRFLLGKVQKPIF
jgi:hypothetical protein